METFIKIVKIHAVPANNLFQKYFDNLSKFPKVGQKKKNGEEKKMKLLVTMASYALQTPPPVAHAKPPGPT